MQLPRGTFRGIRKTVTIGSLIHALEGERYTGIASLSSPAVSGTIVFREGRFLLVEFGSGRGDAGLEACLQSENEVVDAALSLLGDAQVELALEFNKPCRLTKSGKQVWAPPVHRATLHTLREPNRPAAGRPVPSPAASRPAAGPAATPPRSQPPAPAARPAPGAGPVLRKEPAPETAVSGTDGFEEDLEEFESMDLDSVTDKLRNDCKTMIKQLQLDHLMER